MSLEVNDFVKVPAFEVPCFRGSMAVQRGTVNNFLIYVNGGMGDAICAEPTIRWAIGHFKQDKFTIVTSWPDLYRHLAKYGATIGTWPEGERPKPSDYAGEYNVIQTYISDNALGQQFIRPMWTNVIDYYSISMFRCQLPPAFKSIDLGPTLEEAKAVWPFNGSLVIHPGLTWPSRTLPAWWWTEVIHHIKLAGICPVLAGGVRDTRRGVGTLDEVDGTGCIDLRGKLTLMEGVALYQRAKVVLTNDSGPLHMAASGDAWIGFVPTVKRPDLLMHWRGPENKLGWHMVDITNKGLWLEENLSPSELNFRSYKECTEEQMNSWLPKASDASEWAINTFKGRRTYE